MRSVCRISVRKLFVHQVRFQGLWADASNKSCIHLNNEGGNSCPETRPEKGGDQHRPLRLPHFAGLMRTCSWCFLGGFAMVTLEMIWGFCSRAKARKRKKASKARIYAPT